MRRQCDTRDGQRTGVGRRARDRLLAGEVADLSSVPAPRRADARNTMLFVADDLREAALAVGGIEQFLVDAQRLLAGEDVTPERLLALLDDDDLDARLGALDDAVGTLRRSLTELAERLNGG